MLTVNLADTVTLERSLLIQAHVKSMKDPCEVDINDAGNYLFDVISNILYFSKIEAGMMEIFNNVVQLKSSIDECLIMVQERIDRLELNLSVHIVEDLASLVADRTRIKQIILNLLSNSEKFILKPEVLKSEPRLMI